VKPLLEAVGLSYRHPSGFELAGVSCRLYAGDLVALVGPNGAGKSTLLKLLAGIWAAQQGEVFLSDEPLSGLAPRERACRVAWVPQEMDAPPEWPVEDLARLGLHPLSGLGGWAPDAADERRVEEILVQLELGPLRRRPVGSLSGGERRRALLARALSQGAPVLLLDEPTTHLDPRHQADLAVRLRALCRARKTAVVMALHDVNLALEVCGRAWLLEGGRLTADGPAAQALRPDALTRAYGVRAAFAPAGSRFFFRSSFEEEHP
jgi:iron complex transport system ATP-binding protein